MPEQPLSFDSTAAWTSAPQTTTDYLDNIVARYNNCEYSSLKHSESVTKIETDYNRPLTGWLAWFNRFLGPLPENCHVIEPDQATLELVPRQRVLAGLTALFATALLFGLALLLPALRVSPLSLISKVAHSYLHGIWANIAVGLVFALLINLVMKIGNSGTLPSKGKIIDNLAMSEEQWFRMGAESWTVQQRIQSCCVFGFIHIQNLFYPITSLLVLTLIGGLFMALYMSYYRKTGDYRLATLYSARFHATYNRFAFLIMGIGIIGYIVSFFIT